MKTSHSKPSIEGALKTALWNYKPKPLNLQGGTLFNPPPRSLPEQRPTGGEMSREDVGPNGCWGRGLSAPSPVRRRGAPLSRRWLASPRPFGGRTLPCNRLTTSCVGLTPKAVRPRPHPTRKTFPPKYQAPRPPNGRGDEPRGRRPQRMLGTRPVGSISCSAARSAAEQEMARISPPVRRTHPAL
jgi:hypothetical protein